MLDEVGVQFVAMPMERKLRFLAAYTHEITTLARGHFLEEDFESARRCNETVHRVSGFMTSLLRNPEGLADASFVDMLVRGASQSGWSAILERSLQTTLS